MNGNAAIEMARSSSFIFKDVVVQFDDGGFKIGAKSVLLIAKVEVLDLSIATYQFGNFFYAGDGSTTLLAVIGQEREKHTHSSLWQSVSFVASKKQSL